MALRVLIIDDEKNIRATLSVCLEGMGCQVTAVSSAEAALAALGRQVFDLAFLDLRLGDMNGLDLLPKLLAESPDLAVVVITAYATVDTAVEAIKGGAKDYLPAPSRLGRACAAAPGPSAQPDHEHGYTWEKACL
jgi:NtrC-family two-component system response regulator AlgB